MKLKWWIDASFSTHPDMPSDTGCIMSVGHGTIYSTSIRQQVNTKCSTEAEMVGLNDLMEQVLWTRPL